MYGYIYSCRLYILLYVKCFVIIKIIQKVEEESIGLHITKSYINLNHLINTRRRDKKLHF